MFETFTLRHKITYGQLHQLLRDLGFTEHRITLPQRAEAQVFAWPESDFTVNLAVHEADELASSTDVGSVRRLLDMQQIMETDDFDQWMVQADHEHTTTKTG